MKYIQLLCCLVVSHLLWLESISLGQGLALDLTRVLNVSFTAPGQVCLSEAEQRRLIEALKHADIPDQAAISLISFSDALELKPSASTLSPDCVPEVLLPAEIVGHQRIAILRALAVISIARKASISAFGKPPITWGGALPDTPVNRDPSVIAIIPKRTSGEGASQRRVEIHWELPAKDVVERPSQAGLAIGIYNSIPSDAAAQSAAAKDVELIKQVDQRSNRLRLGKIVGIGLFATGASLAIVGGGFFGAAYQSRDAYTTAPSRQEAFVFLEQERGYWQAGGWAVGVGGGLALAGLTSFLFSIDYHPKQTARSEK